MVELDIRRSRDGQLFLYPHIIAHRGASGIAPENTLPSIARALELGVDEVEFDLWATKDGTVVACHDPTLDRTTNAAGRISEHSWNEIRRLDGGAWFGAAWQGVAIPAVEEIFELVGNRAWMNVHLKEPGKNGFIVSKVRDLSVMFNVTDRVYITGKRDVLLSAKNLAPELARCCLEGQENGRRQLENTLLLDCQRVQFSVNCCTDEDIRKARGHGLGVNYFFCDDPAEARHLVSVGVTGILTNHPEIIRRDTIL